jgi:hypothetical protein
VSNFLSVVMFSHGFVCTSSFFAHGLGLIKSYWVCSHREAVCLSDKDGRETLVLNPARLPASAVISSLLFLHKKVDSCSWTFHVSPGLASTP